MARPTSISTSSLALLAVVVLAGVAQAWRLAWTCDDAFISFRYAENLVHGLGLVFNAGERVEGYTNFLWTLWIALGMTLGFEPEGWSIGWGIAFHAATIALLAWRSITRARAAGWPLAVPVAALVAVAHEDWSVHATSGLETSMFVFLLVAGFLLAVDGVGRPARLALAGLAFGLATLTRPDGALFATLAGAWLWLPGSRRAAGALAFGGAFAAVVVPCLLWRLAYYGDLAPNTYYAKSAHLPWVSQGLVYAGLYLQKYGVLLLGPLLATLAAIVAWRVPRASGSARDPGGREALLAAGFAIAHAAYVVRVGGDFMYARMLIPATPFLLVLLEREIVARCGARPALALGAGLAMAGVLLLAPHPLPDHRDVAGIVNERTIYDREIRAAIRHKGEVLRRHLEGLDVRVAFAGGEARTVYYSKVPVAIECATGLTDRTIARQPLQRRGRVGHEKRPSVAYLLETRGVQLAFHRRFADELGYTDSLWTLPVEIGGASCALLRWDAPLVASLQARGARIVDFPRLHDELRASGQLAAMPPEQRERLRRFSPAL